MVHRWFLIAVFVLLGGCSGSGSDSTSGSSQSDASSSVSSTQDCPQGYRVVGYFPAWQGRVEDIQYDYLTHINYAFVLPRGDGGLSELTTQSENRLMALVTMAEAASVKVGIAVGGWNGGDDSAFVAMAADAEARQRFIVELVTMVERYQLDGVDMDWEYPSTPDQAEHYLALMSELRTALDELPGAHYLSAAVVASGDWAGRYIPEAVFEEVDFLNLMAYDEHDREPHSTMSYARSSLNYWAERGLSREKSVLGVPFYARPSWSAYKDLVAADRDNACRDQAGDDHYNGVPTIRAKTRLAMDRACGVMIWELSQDTGDETSLLKAIWEVTEGRSPGYICP